MNERKSWECHRCHAICAPHLDKCACNRACVYRTDCENNKPPNGQKCIDCPRKELPVFDANGLPLAIDRVCVANATGPGGMVIVPSAFIGKIVRVMERVRP